MDKLIPILIVIAIYFFKFYNNYKKEQEKNQNRKVPQNKTNPTPYERRVATSPANIPQPTNTRERLPKLEKAVQENMSRKDSKQPQINTPWYKSTTETYPATAEDTASLQYEERPLLSEPLPKSNIKVVKLEEEISAIEDKAQMTFDLREAVIQAAILERPYK